MKIRKADVADAAGIARVHIDSWVAAYRGMVDDEFEGLDPATAAELVTIYLDPSVWGQGIGHALMDVALNDLRERGFASAVLWVLEENKRARQFYEAGGWREDGNRKDCFGAVQVQAPAVRYSIDL
ncbi:MAG: GNAT family N-acetyltransferase [Actinomycetota bacterium]